MASPASPSPQSFSQANTAVLGYMLAIILGIALVSTVAVMGVDTKTTDKSLDSTSSVDSVQVGVSSGLEETNTIVINDNPDTFEFEGESVEWDQLNSVGQENMGTLLTSIQSQQQTTGKVTQVAPTGDGVDDGAFIKQWDTGEYLAERPYTEYHDETHTHTTNHTHNEYKWKHPHEGKWTQICHGECQWVKNEGYDQVKIYDHQHGWKQNCHEKTTQDDGAKGCAEYIGNGGGTTKFETHTHEETTGNETKTRMVKDYKHTETERQKDYKHTETERQKDYKHTETERQKDYMHTETKTVCGPIGCIEKVVHKEWHYKTVTVHEEWHYETVTTHEEWHYKTVTVHEEWHYTEEEYVEEGETKEVKYTHGSDAVLKEHAEVKGTNIHIHEQNCAGCERFKDSTSNHVHEWTEVHEDAIEHTHIQSFPVNGGSYTYNNQSDWTMMTDIQKYRDSTFVIEKNGLADNESDAFQMSTDDWTMKVWNKNNDIHVKTNTGYTQSYTGSAITIDPASNTINGNQNSFTFANTDDTHSLSITNGDMAFGDYKLVTNGGLAYPHTNLVKTIETSQAAITVADEIVYDADLTVTYESGATSVTTRLFVEPSTEATEKPT